MQKNDHGIWTTGQVRWVVNGSTQLHWSREVGGLKSSVAEVVFFARDCQRAGRSGIGYLGKRGARTNR